MQPAICLIFPGMDFSKKTWYCIKAYRLQKTPGRRPGGAAFYLKQRRENSMGLFRFAVGALMTTSHPEVNRKQCWNLSPHKNKCERCVEVCPKAEKIFKRPGLVQDWNACTDCGLCVSACKTRCIAPSKEQVDRDCAPADSRSETIWIGCERSQRQNDLLRDCVGALSWEMLAYLALNKKLVLDLTPCGECENDGCADNLRRVLERLVEFFGEPVFNARIALAYEADKHPYVTQNVSRRELMDIATDTSKSSTRRLLHKLPGMEENGGHEMDFRLLLNERTKLIRNAASVPIHYGFYLPAVNEKCYGCGKCERACKAGALKLEDGADGLTRMIVTPWKCSECGQCAASCMAHAMDGMTLRQVTTLGPVIVRKFQKRLCEECGKPMPLTAEENVCKVCAIRRRTKKRQEEAAEKAKQRAAEREAKLKEEKNALLEKKQAAAAHRASKAAEPPAGTEAAQKEAPAPGRTVPGLAQKEPAPQ